MRRTAACGIAMMALSMVWATVALTAMEEPVAVSPGSGTGLAVVEGRCPTFSWSSVAEADAYELVVFRLKGGSEELETVLRPWFSGSVDSWTPSLDRCLEAGARYAWAVRAIGEHGASTWSEPRLFELREAASWEGIAATLATLRRALGSEEGAFAPTGRALARPSPGRTQDPTQPLASRVAGDGTAAANSRDNVGIYSDVPDVTPGAIEGRTALVGIAGESGSGDPSLSVGAEGISLASYGTGVAASGYLGVDAISQDGAAAGRFTGTGDAQGLTVDADVCCDGNSNSDYAAQIWNLSGSGEDGDVLALGLTEVTSAVNNNFIGFFDFESAAGGTLDLIGEIEGDGAGGVHFTGSAGSIKASAADFAEYLPRLDPTEKLAPGDVVGLVGAKVTSRTGAAQRVLVVSEDPLILGNVPAPEVGSHFTAVALLGQVEVRVRGPVAVGDLLMASGADDGTAVSVAVAELTEPQTRLLVGRALEGSGSAGEARVRALVGLPEAAALTASRKTPPGAQIAPWLLASLCLLGIGVVVGRAERGSLLRSRKR